MAISESIVDSSTEEAAAAAACDVGIVVVSACISSREGTYRCNDDDVFVIPCCFRTGIIVVGSILFGSSILVETTGGEVLLGVVNDVT